MSSKLRRDNLLGRIAHAISDPLDFVDEDIDDTRVWRRARAVERALIDEGVLDEVDAG